MDGQIAFFQDAYFCTINNKTVTLSGVKHSIYNFGKLVNSTIIDAKCNGDTDCLYDRIFKVAPKNTNIKIACSNDPIWPYLESPFQ